MIQVSEIRLIMCTQYTNFKENIFRYEKASSCRSIQKREGLQEKGFCSKSSNKIPVTWSTLVGLEPLNLYRYDCAQIISLQRVSQHRAQKVAFKVNDLALLVSIHHHTHNTSFPPLHLLTPTHFPSDYSFKICFHLRSPRWSFSASPVWLINRRVSPDPQTQALAFPECTIWMQNSS